MVLTDLGGVPAELAAALAPLAGLWREAGHALLAPDSLPAAVTVLAGAMLAVALAASLAGAARTGQVLVAAPLIRRAAALRAKSWRAAFLPQRDPDAAGRPRPRAPSAAQAAAAS